MSLVICGSQTTLEYSRRFSENSLLHVRSVLAFEQIYTNNDRSSNIAMYSMKAKVATEQDCPKIQDPPRIGMIHKRAQTDNTGTRARKPSCAVSVDSTIKIRATRAPGYCCRLGAFEPFLRLPAYKGGTDHRCSPAKSSPSASQCYMADKWDIVWSTLDERVRL